MSARRKAFVCLYSLLSESEIVHFQELMIYHFFLPIQVQDYNVALTEKLHREMETAKVIKYLYNIGWL